MAMNVADTLVETAVRAGVERVYGVIGDSLNPIGDAIRRNGRLRWVHVRHEEVGAFAAGAEAQLTGKATMCAGSAGPGHLHLLNGLCDANRTRAPVFAARLDHRQRRGRGFVLPRVGPRHRVRQLQRLRRHLFQTRAGSPYFRDGLPTRHCPSGCRRGGAVG